MSAFERSTIRLAKVNIGVVAVTGLFICLQWCEMRSGSVDTHTLAEASRVQAQQLETLAHNAGAQSVATVEQANNTQRLADRMKDQTDQTKTIAGQAVIQAGAATSAAKTAENALHVSERAYIDIGAPQLDMNLKSVTVPFLNNGHIPSGRVEVVAHESTNDVPDIYTHPNLFAAIERNWECTAFQAIPPGPGFSIVIPVTKMNSDKLKIGLQLIIVAGFVSYNDGFTDTRQVTRPFCVHTQLSLKTKELALSPCDPSDYLPKLESVDGYPKNQQSDEPDRPN